MPPPAAPSTNRQRRLRCLRARRRVAGRRWSALLGWAGLRSMTRKPRRMLPPNSVNVAIMMRTKKPEGSIVTISPLPLASRWEWPGRLGSPKRVRSTGAAQGRGDHPGGRGQGTGGVNDRRRGCAGEPTRALRRSSKGKMRRKPCWASARAPPRHICQQTLRRLTRAGSARRGPRRPAPGPGTRDWLGVFWRPHRHR